MYETGGSHVWRQQTRLLHAAREAAEANSVEEQQNGAEQPPADGVQAASQVAEEKSEHGNAEASESKHKFKLARKANNA